MFLEYLNILVFSLPHIGTFVFVFIFDLTVKNMLFITEYCAYTGHEFSPVSFGRHIVRKHFDFVKIMNLCVSTFFPPFVYTNQNYRYGTKIRISKRYRCYVQDGWVLGNRIGVTLACVCT